MKVTNSDMKKVILAKLDDAKGDINKRWCIYFSFVNPYTLKLERKRVYNGINNFNDANLRYSVASVLIQQYNEKLKNGWTPYQETDTIYYDPGEVSFLPQNYNRENASLPSYLMGALKSKHALRDKSYKTYKSIVTSFTYYLEANKIERITINQFTKQMAETFLHWLVIEKKKSHVTRNKYLAILKNLWIWLIENKYAKINVWDKIPKLKEIRHGKLPFTPMQKDLLKDLIGKENPQLWLFCLFQYYCMIRPGELRLLKVENIHFDLQKIMVPGEIAKNKKTQFVTIPTPFFKILYEHALHFAPGMYYVFSANGQPGALPMSRDYFSKLHRTYLNRLRISNKYSLYSWKHTGNVAAVKSGIGIKDLQLQNRHHDLNTFDIYLRSMGVDDFEALKNSFPEV
jgi:integrase